MYKYISFNPKIFHSNCGWKNEGSFGCKAFACAVGQPNVPECAVGFCSIFQVKTVWQCRFEFASLPLTPAAKTRQGVKTDSLSHVNG